MRPPRPLPALCTALAAAIATGCGNGADGGESGEPPARARSGQLVRIVADEYFFDPRRVIVTGPARGRPAAVRFRLVNEGVLAHNLKVFDGQRELGGTPTFAGGQARPGSLRLAPGRYRMVCTVGDHAELGMIGELEVRAP